MDILSEKSKKQKAIVCYFCVRSQRGGIYSEFASIFQKATLGGDELKINWLPREREGIGRVKRQKRKRYFSGYTSFYCFDFAAM